MMLSVEERTFLVEHVFRCGGEYTQDVQQRLQAQFLETKVPHCTAVQQLIQKFMQTGSVCNATRSGRPSILTEKKVLNISDRTLRSLKESIRKLTQQVGVCLIWHGATPTPLQNYSCA
jgi:transposase